MSEEKSNRAKKTTVKDAFRGGKSKVGFSGSMRKKKRVQERKGRWNQS